METSREKLEVRCIICGFGRIGSMAAGATMREGRPAAGIAAARGRQGAVVLENLHRLDEIL